MKITLAGSPGSGKSTLRNKLAEYYGLKIKGTGDFMRELSKKHGYSDITKFISEYVTEHPEMDLQVDEEQRVYGEENDDFVLDAHLGFHFVPDSIRICLKCDSAESARRILEDKKSPPFKESFSLVANHFNMINNTQHHTNVKKRILFS